MNGERLRDFFKRRSLYLSVGQQSWLASLGERFATRSKKEMKGSYERTFAGWHFVIVVLVTECYTEN